MDLNDSVKPSQRAKKSPSASDAPVEAHPPPLIPGPRLSLNPRTTGIDIDNLMRNFPGTPRPQQVEALEKISAAFNHGAEYVVLEAPPGVGKSHIAMTLAQTLGPAYITTLTAQLQGQYVREFGHLDLAELKGRGKYTCTRASESCAIGGEVFKEDPCSTCPYVKAKEKAFAARTMVANYHSFMWNVGKQSDEFQKSDDLPENNPIRPFMILDEAHSIEGFLLDQIGIEVKLTQWSVKLPALPTQDVDVQPYIDWLKEVVPILKGIYASITDAKAKLDLGRSLSKMVSIQRDHATGTEFIAERGNKRAADGQNGWEMDPTWFALKPLTVGNHGRMLWKWGNRMLLMSATVLDAGTLVTNLGLDLSRGDFVQLGSGFAKENRPIKVFPMPMTKEHREDTDEGPGSWTRTAELVDRLMDHHALEKGLLLCPSNEMLKYISAKLSRKNSNRLITAFGNNREQRYDEHVKSSLPTVLAASGYWEGADLKDDASRFQIIPAVPRAMWNGQIKARAKQSPAWYRWLSYTKLIQGYGRSVRSADDHAVTYIFDQEFLTELNRGRGSLIPDWVREAVTVVGQ